MFFVWFCFFFAYQSSQGPGDQVTEAVTGRFTAPTTWFLIPGAASPVAGVGLLVFMNPQATDADIRDASRHAETPAALTAPTEIMVWSFGWIKRSLFL